MGETLTVGSRSRRSGRPHPAILLAGVALVLLWAVASLQPRLVTFGISSAIGDNFVRRPLPVGSTSGTVVGLEPRGFLGGEVLFVQPSDTPTPARERLKLLDARTSIWTRFSISGRRVSKDEFFTAIWRDGVPFEASPNLARIDFTSSSAGDLSSANAVLLR